MHTSLKNFMRQFTAVVLMSLVPVALVAFLSIPFTLGHHPGESQAQAVVTLDHEA
ncbi:MAG: hypothetical protein Q7T97_05985 [Burkholderiaceae bacterium]|nr:hypothetical protein [Burkholderiaceae bacterium]